MKIILSRKGFDSSAGGVPSPILPDGRPVSLPIPDPHSHICYRDIRQFAGETGKLVADLTRGRINASATAHLDPDLSPSSLPREPGWCPLFGQSGAAQGHLRNQRVDTGDVFLFFGLFQRVKKTAGKFVFDHSCPRQHIFFGWLQIGAIEPVNDCSEQTQSWAGYHPHFSHPPSVNNTLYLASDKLKINGGLTETLDGAGLFESVSNQLILTADDAKTPSQWQLPPWFYPTGNKTPLSYHNNPNRWQNSTVSTRLQAASRGQEFVLDCDHYPEALGWLRNLIKGT